MKRHSIVMFVPVALLLAVVTACSSGTPAASPTPTKVSSLSLAPAQVKQLVQQISSKQGEGKEVESASITSDQLQVTANGQQTRYDLPQDEYFVSIAPYLQQTHDCQIHSLTGCQGELTNQEFVLTITDSSGTIIMNQQKQVSGDNGFIDLWLPRNDTYTVKVEQDGKTAEQTISTFANDDTCISTMQLS